MHEQVQPSHFICRNHACLTFGGGRLFAGCIKMFVVTDVAVHSYMQKRNGLYDTNIPEKSSVQSRLSKERFQLVLERD